MDPAPRMCSGGAAIDYNELFQKEDAGRGEVRGER